MIHQSVLDLTPPLTLLPSLAGSCESGRDIEYRSLRSPGRLTRRSLPDLEPLDSVTTWNLEPYRGLEFETVTDAPRAGRRKRRILVNASLPEALARKLSSPECGRLSIGIGDRFDAYPNIEQSLTVTRSVLRVLQESRGHRIDLTTRSPLVLRDQNLLRRLDMSHAVTVRVPIATLDERLAARFEPNTATPASRLEIVRRLARDGITVVVSCGPILPGINNSADELDPLFDAIRRAGGLDVIGDARLALPKCRRRVAAWLDRHFPERAAAVLGQLAKSGGKEHLGTLERLRLSYGFPVQRAGRG